MPKLYMNNGDFWYVSNMTYEQLQEAWLSALEERLLVVTGKPSHVSSSGERKITVNPNSIAWIVDDA